MAEFTITLLRPADNHETTVYYDNMTNELRWKDGRPIIDAAPDPHKWGEAFAVSKETPGEKADVKTLKISLGLSCNYGCTYCSQRFVPHKVDAGLNDIEPFLTKLPTWFNIGGTDGLGAGNRIEFWGGEPFVYVKTLVPLANALRKMMPNAVFSVITNGSLLTLEINEWLDELGFDVGISHDGPGQHVRGPDPLANETNRAAILDLYHRLHPKNRISINAMIHRDNTSRAKVQQWMKEVFGEDVPIGEGSFIDPYDAGGLASMLDEKDHGEYRLQTLAELRLGNFKNFHVSMQKLRGFVHHLRNRRPASNLGQKCGMDRPTNMAVTLKGDVMTCQNVSPVAKAPNGESHKIGTVDRLSEVKLKTATHWSKRPLCSDCPVLHLCGGACMFLEGKLWDVACDSSFSDNIPFFAAALEYLTGGIPIRIDGPLPERRKDIWGAPI